MWNYSIKIVSSGRRTKAVYMYLERSFRGAFHHTESAYHNDNSKVENLQYPRPEISPHRAQHFTLHSRSATARKWFGHGHFHCTTEIILAIHTLTGDRGISIKWPPGYTTLNPDVKYGGGKPITVIFLSSSCSPHTVSFDLWSRYIINKHLYNMT